MNYVGSAASINLLGGLFSKGCQLAKKAFSAIPYADKVAEVATGIFYELVPHVVSVSPAYLSRMTNMRVLSVIGLTVGGYSDLDIVFNKKHETWKETIGRVVMASSKVIGIVDLLGWILVKKEYRIAIDTLSVLATAIGGYRASSEGTKRILSSLNGDGTNTTSKVSQFVSGCVLTILGAAGLCSALDRGMILTQALNLNLDTLELKQRQYGSLEPKQCKAVIFDGLVGGKDFVSGVPFPFAEAIHDNCETLTYNVESTEGFCDSLFDAKTRMGSINVVSIMAHSNNEGQYFNNGYIFNGWNEVTCMRYALPKEAQVFLVGCNTATPAGKVPTLTEIVSMGLPGREVTGFAAFYNPFFTTTRFTNGRFSHENYFPLDLHGSLSFGNAVLKQSQEGDSFIDFLKRFDSDSDA